MAARGCSRDSRPDCKQVCIGLVCTPEGLPLSCEVFAGNRTDVTTVEEIVRTMEEKYGQPQRVWVMDRGMVSEENIEFLRARGARYLVGTPKSQLRQFEAQLLEKEGWSEVQSGLEARLVAHPDGKGQEQSILCRSSARGQKEAAMPFDRLRALSLPKRPFDRLRALSLPKRPFDRLRASGSACAPSITKPPPESKRTSSCASSPWRCGAPWKCGCTAKASAPLRLRSGP